MKTKLQLKTSYQDFKKEKTELSQIPNDRKKDRAAKYDRKKRSRGKR